MKKDKKAQWTLYRINKKEIGFVYEPQGVMDDDPQVGFITISNGQMVQTRELISSLTSISFEKKAAWITDHSRVLANMGSDVVGIITDANRVTSQVEQALKAIQKQNAAVGIAKGLEDSKLRQAVSDAIPALTTSLDSNEPKLLIAEAHEIYKILGEFYAHSAGSLRDQLEVLLLKTQNLFPEEVFRQ